MRRLLTVLLLFGFVTPAAALLDEAVYRAEIAVENHGAGELNRAVRAGLAQVLVKLSGSSGVLADEQIHGALARGRNYLQQYQYQRAGDGELRLIIVFDRELVMQILTDAGQPVWANQRPPVLVWMVVDDAAARRFGNASDSTSLRRELREGFSRRALPVSFPLYDLQDNLALDVQNLWELDSASIVRASQRYRAEHVLVARLSLDSQGRWTGDWLYLDTQGSSAVSLHAADDRVAAGAGVSLAAEAMAARYALQPSAADRAGLLVRVDGLQRYTDYRQVLTHLQGLELVEDARLEFLHGESAIFRLQVKLQEQQLQRLLTLKGKLEPIQPAEPLRASPDMASAFVARSLQRHCGGADALKDAEGMGADGLKDAEGIVGATHASPVFEGVSPATASDSAAAVEGWCNMRATSAEPSLAFRWLP